MRRSVVLVALVLTACTSAPQAAPITSEQIPELVELIDPSGQNLPDAGVPAFRFESTVGHTDDPRLAAVYRGVVTMDPYAAELTSEGFTGDFAWVNIGDVEWYRWDAGWMQTRSESGFRWLPAGPIPTYSLASIVATIAMTEGEPQVVGRTTVATIPVVHLRREVNPTLMVEAYVSDAGVVAGVRMTELSSDGELVTEWRIVEVDDALSVSEPADVISR